MSCTLASSSCPVFMNKVTELRPIIFYILKMLVELLQLVKGQRVPRSVVDNRFIARKYADLKNILVDFLVQLNDFQMVVETNLKFLLEQKLLNRSCDTFISLAIKLWWSKYFCSAI